MASPKRKPTNPGQRKAKYRANVETRLASLGYSARKYRWEAAPACLTVIIGDEFRSFALHAGQSIAKTEHELGRLATWAEVLNLAPPPALPQPTTKTTRHRKAALAGQIDIEELIAASHKPNGALHAGAA